MCENELRVEEIEPRYDQHNEYGPEFVHEPAPGLKPSRRLTVAPIPPGIRSIPVRENQDRFMHFTPKARHLRIENSSAMKPGGTASKFGDELYRLSYR
jgi:hypothetical protein